MSIRALITYDKRIYQACDKKTTDKNLKLHHKIFHPSSCFPFPPLPTSPKFVGYLNREKLGKTLRNPCEMDRGEYFSPLYLEDIENNSTRYSRYLDVFA